MDEGNLGRSIWLEIEYLGGAGVGDAAERREVKVNPEILSNFLPKVTKQRLIHMHYILPPFPIFLRISCVHRPVSLLLFI